MISKRDILIGAACVLASGTAFALKPRREVSLLKPGQRLDRIVPRVFENWTSRDVSDFFAPETPDSLVAKLYGETVGRVYSQASTGYEVMMLLAHGDVQSNELQLHRPEVCYPAFGFEILSSVSIQLPLARSVSVPSRLLVAKSPDHQETVIYWSRMGEYFPQSGGEQRVDRLKAAMDGYIPDGVLARFSISGPDSVAAQAGLENFISALVRAVSPNARDVLIGSARALALAQNPTKSGL